MAWTLDGIIIESGVTLFIAALVIGLLNAFLRPIVILLTLPLNILTLGLFTFVINAVLLLFASQLVTGFFVDGFWTAFFAALIMSIVGFLLNLFIPGRVTFHKTHIIATNDAPIIDVEAHSPQEEQTLEEEEDKH